MIVNLGMVRVDTQHLIKEVFDRRSLWDKWHPNFHTRTVQEAYWGEISQACGASRIEVRHKWKSLKDTYRKEVKKVLAGGKRGYKPTWLHYKSLQFLYKQVAPPQPGPGASIALEGYMNAEPEFQSCGTTNPQVIVVRGQEAEETETLIKLEPPDSEEDPTSEDITELEDGRCPEDLGTEATVQTFSAVSFVDQVYKRRELWDKRHPHHHHKGVLDRLWTEIAAIYGMKSVEMHLKWKHLKDGFRKELRRAQESGQTEFKSRHPHYHRMMFLQDQMTVPSPVAVNCSNGPDFAMDTSSDANAEDEKVEFNDDYHFFMSLIPLTRHLDTVRKLKLRSRIHEVIIEELSKPE